MDKYLQYTPIELADDDSFIRWVKNKPRKGDLDWNTWLATNVNKASDIQIAKKIVLGIKFKQESVSQMTEDKVWSNIKENIGSSKNSGEVKQGKKTSIIKLISYGAVAAVALVLLMFSLRSDYDTSMQTSYAMIKTVNLPDGSTVQMNSDSKIEYNTESWSENRFVSLNGEAFFTVQKGSKFTVKTEQGNIKVLGTSFNVNTRNKILNVICKTGKVSVSNSKKETILTTNQSVNIVKLNHEFIDKDKSVVDRSNWINGSYSYVNESLSNVIGDLERLYDVTITIDKNLTSEKYTGGFKKGDIDNSLSEVLWPIGLKFSVDGNKVTVTKE